MTERKTKELKKRVNYTLNPKLHEKLVSHSEESGFSQSMILEMALIDYFKKLESNDRREI